MTERYETTRSRGGHRASRSNGREVVKAEIASPLNASVPARNGQPVQCRAALQLRDAMIERLASLPALPGALDQIIQHFGAANVAEVTGRSRRIVKHCEAECERLAVETRPASANLSEAQSFMDDEKRVLVFSDAGGTGRSYHADLGAKNQRRRIHYLLEAGLRPGMLLTDATAIAPELRASPQNVHDENAHLRRLAMWCRRYTPWVAPDPPDGLRLDITGCAHLCGGEADLLRDIRGRFARAGFNCRAAIASTPGTAWAMARYAPKPLAIIAHGEERVRLAPLSVRALPISTATRRRRRSCRMPFPSPIEAPSHRRSGQR